MTDLGRIARRVGLEAALAAIGLALALAPFGQYWIAAALALLYGGRLVFHADKAQRVFYLGFGLVWVLADIGFVRTGVFAYAETTRLGPPVYMPLVFGQLAVLVGEAVGWMPPEDTRLPIWLDLGVLGAGAGAVMLLYARAPGVLAVAFTAALIGRAALGRFAWRGLAVAAAFGVGEPLLEALLINRGLFAFARPALLGVPVWYWSFFAFASYGVARAFAAATGKLRGA